MSTFRRDATATGVALAAAIGLCLAVMGLAIGPDWSTPLAFALPLSLPVGVLLAWRHARAVAESPGFPFGRVVVMCLQALVFGALLVGLAGAIVGSLTGTETFSSPWEVIGLAAASALLGIIFVGIPMLALIGLVIVLWVVVLRRLIRAPGIPRGKAWRRVAIWGLVTVAAALGANFLWPVLGAVGLADVGWYASLLLWFVLTPIGAVMLVVSVLQARIGMNDERAIERYRYLLQTAPPEDIERAHEEAFARLTPEQRAMVLRELSEKVPASELGGDDPRSLARAATRAEMREPGTMERTFGGAVPGLGSMFLSTLAGAFIGSSIANAFDDGGSEGSSDAEGNDGDMAGDTGDSGGDVGGGDFGGGDFGGGDFGG